MSLSSPPGTERDVRQMGCHRVARSSGKSLPLTYPAAGAKESKSMSSDVVSASLSPPRDSPGLILHVSVWCAMCATYHIYDNPLRLCDCLRVGGRLARRTGRPTVGQLQNLRSVGVTALH